jgi:hypothetical protein
MTALDRIQIEVMMSSLEKDASYLEQQQSLVLLAKECGIINPDGSSLTTMDINRLLLTLRYNGFESGLYLHFNMFNHDEDPNCIKYRPEEESEQKVPYNFSEARATQFVKKGEALTLHYLWDQHCFDIGDEDVFLKYVHSPRNIYESELVGGKFPASTREETTNDHHHSIHSINIVGSLGSS